MIAETKAYHFDYTFIIHYIEIIQFTLYVM